MFLTSSSSIALSLSARVSEICSSGKVTDREAEYNILQEIKNKLKNDFNLAPCLGAELEFYLLGVKGEEDISSLENAFNLHVKPHYIIIKKERGDNQYEIEIPPSTDVEAYPEIIRQMRKLIMQEAKKLNLEADFTPKPFVNDFGSSMHIHLNFLEDKNVEKYAEILCHYLPATINAFLPTKEDYVRLDSRFLAPTHISYGGNNRTVLIRIPDQLPRRLEHRLASANADPCKVIYAILSSLRMGLEQPEKIIRLAKTYGNAYDPQYNLVKILPF